ncbi:MAG: hypothetical protein ACE37F_10535 [Nannocystaceae bacterium]|nr:hypothetical protein [bacterium]
MRPFPAQTLLGALFVLSAGCFSPNAAVEDGSGDTGSGTGASSSTGSGGGSEDASTGVTQTTTGIATTSTETTGTTEAQGSSTVGDSGSTGQDTSATDTSGGSDSTTGDEVNFEGDYEGIILGDCDDFPTGFVEVDGTLEFAVFETTAVSGSADLTVPYSDNTVPMMGTIDGEGAIEATLTVSGSVSCALVGNASDDGEITGTFTCDPHQCDGLWSASPV